MKNILITGVSSGIGYSIAKEFIKQDYKVYGSVRKEEDAVRLTSEFGKNYVPLIFDITDHSSIQRAADSVKEQLVESGLSGLINNAGATEGGPLMHMPIETFQKHLDVLVTGQLVVTQAFLPFLIAEDNRSAPGRIMMIGSTSGKAGFPFVGAYAASKHALEGLSKSLRAELLLYGIEVIVIGPGNINTPIWSKNKPETIDFYKDTKYYLPLLRMHKYLEKTVPNDSLDPDKFSRKILKIFESKRPRLRYTIVNKPIKHWIINNIIPERMKIKTVARIFGIKG